MTAQACPGACNSAWRATHEGQPHPGDPVWCAWDAARTRRFLAELPDLAALREFQVNGFREAARSPARGGNTPSPSDAGDDVDELDDVLVGWEMAYRADFNRRNPGRPMLPSPPRRGVIATVTDTTAAWLTRHLDDILASDMAVPFAEEIAQAHREFMAKTRAGTGRRLGAIPCPWCDWMTLACESGADYWACSNPGPPPCRCRLKMAEYNELVAAAHRELERAG